MGLKIGLTIGRTTKVGTAAPSSAWNNADKATGIVISGTGNLTATGGGGSFQAVRGTISKSSGTRQIEATIVSVGGGQNTAIGFANGSASLTAYIGSDANGVAYYHTSFVGGYTSSTGTPVAYIAGDVIGAVWNQGAGTVTFYKNGVQQITGPVGFGSTAFPAFCDQGAGSLTLKTSGTFAYPIGGAVAWDS